MIIYMPRTGLYTDRQIFGIATLASVHPPNHDQRAAHDRLRDGSESTTPRVALPWRSALRSASWIDTLAVPRGSVTADDVPQATQRLPARPAGRRTVNAVIAARHVGMTQFHAGIQDVAHALFELLRLWEPATRTDTHMQAWHRFHVSQMWHRWRRGRISQALFRTGCSIARTFPLPRDSRPISPRPWS